MRPCHELYCNTRPTSLPTIHRFIDQNLGEKDFDKEWLANVHIVADELASNIEKYAFGSKPSPYLFRIRTEKDHIELEFNDAGRAFDPTLVKQTPLAGDHDRPIGRLGILLVLSLADDVRYLRQGGRNVTTVIMRYPGTESLQEGDGTCQ